MSASMKMFIRSNKLMVAIFMFLTIFISIHYTKPGFIYTADGGFRQFGVGYREKTVIPIWVVSIVVAIMCYWFVLWSLHQ
jgi:hypothetical protein